MPRLVKTALLIIVLCIAARPALSAPADTKGSQNFTGIDQQLSQIQATINQGATSGALPTQAVTALEAKQREIADRKAKLKADPKPTSDEMASLEMSVKEQEGRLSHFARLKQPATRPVDPSSLPPTTYITPNGTTIIAPGGNYGNSGITTGSGGVVSSGSNGGGYGNAVGSYGNSGTGTAPVGTVIVPGNGPVMNPAPQNLQPIGQ